MPRTRRRYRAASAPAWTTWRSLIRIGRKVEVSLNDFFCSFSNSWQINTQSLIYTSCPSGDKTVQDSIRSLISLISPPHPGTNLCGRANGGCHQLCFYLGDNRKTCACAHGYLARDRLGCNRYEGYLLYSERSVLRSIHLSDENNLNSPVRAYENPAYFKNVIALAFDHRQKTKGTNRIFFSDVHYGNIQVINDDWTGRRIIAESECLFIV